MEDVGCGTALGNLVFVNDHCYHTAAGSCTVLMVPDCLLSQDIGQILTIIIMQDSWDGQY